MTMGMKISAKGPERLQCKNAAGTHILAIQERLKGQTNRFISRAREQAEQRAFTLEQTSQNTRDRKGPVAVENGSENLQSKFFAE
jgi:hypothetical protein